MMYQHGTNNHYVNRVKYDPFASQDLGLGGRLNEEDELAQMGYGF
jgi:hypothetical protein